MISFTGDWHSTFGKLSTVQEGQVLRGSYARNGGSLSGQIEGNVFRGTWAESASGKSGPAELTFDEQGNTFHGAWKNKGNEAWEGGWTGVRLTLPAEGQGSPGGWNSRADGPLLSGPMLGEVGPHDARIWVQARSSEPLTLIVHRQDGSEIRTVEQPRWSNWLCRVFHVGGLNAEERCEYAFESANGMTERFRFTTAPPPDARRLKVSFGSCFWNYPESDLPIFDSIAQEGGDVFLMIGDNCYYGDPDWQSEHTMMLANLRHRNNEPLRRLVPHVPVLGIWDDHDFGPNDVDGNFRGKDGSLRAFKRCWAQRSYGTAEAPGVFSAVRVGPVEMFLLDSRYRRQLEGANILGRAQLEWLFARLQGSTAPVKLVVSPSQVLPEHPVRHGWDCFRREAPGELEALLSRIEATDVRGVVFLSGDLHMANLMYMEGRPVGDRQGPDFWELTSSPLANKPWMVAAGPDPYLLEEVIDRTNYGVIDVDLDREGAEIGILLKDENGSVLFERQVPLASLQVR